ncbi:MAG: apolipoprotein N-acyltransferase [Actinomycetota bacterium]|nr:apolipoprotein N-acyltransferase [Actinomycetota bacterium]
MLVVPLLLAAVERATLAAAPERSVAKGAEVPLATLRGWNRASATLMPGRLTAAVGLLAGLVTFLPMLAWLILPAGVVAWVLVSCIQAGWYALVAYLLRRWVHSGWVVLAAPLLWTGMEAWRAAVPLGGFGWGSLAYAHAHGSPLLPAARVVGASGLTFLTALLGALAYDAARRSRVARTRGRSAAGAGLRAVPPLAALVLVGIVAAIVPPGAPPASGRTVDLLTVQGNDLVDFTSSRGEEDAAIAGRMLAETRTAVESGGRPDLTIWPENSIDLDPFTPSGAFLRRYITEGAEVVDGQLLFGTNLDGPDPDLTFRNAAVLVDRNGEQVDRYVKRRYVPFGEYVPWRAVFGKLPPLRQVPRDGQPGAGPQTVHAELTDVAVVICFETLFSDVVRTNVLADDAGLVVALTNDASFGRSWESDQHIAQSQLRAVETGRWVVHAAISGASALIDPDGGVQYRTGLFERATIRAEVPVIQASTPFLAAGDVVGFLARWAALALLLAEVAVRLRRRRLTHQPGQVVEVADGKADGWHSPRADLVVEAGRYEEGP